MASERPRRAKGQGGQRKRDERRGYATPEDAWLGLTKLFVDFLTVEAWTLLRTAFLSLGGKPRPQSPKPQSRPLRRGRRRRAAFSLAVWSRCRLPRRQFLRDLACRLFALCDRRWCCRKWCHPDWLRVCTVALRRLGFVLLVCLFWSESRNSVPDGKSS